MSCSVILTPNGVGGVSGFESVWHGSAAASALSYIRIRGFEINGGYMGLRFDAPDSLIENNYIHDSRTVGIEGNGARTVYQSNVVARSGQDGTICSPAHQLCHGFYTDGDDVKIINNVILDNDAAGVQIYGSTLPDHTAASWLIANNVFKGNAAAFNVWGDGARDDTFANNIFYQNTDVFNWVSSGSGHVIKNNDLYANTNGDTLGTCGGCYSDGGGNITANPLFANPAASDFHLQSTSPAINAGADLSATFTTDLDGKTRRLPFDLGAYEYNLGVNVGGKVSVGGTANVGQ